MFATILHAVINNLWYVFKTIKNIGINVITKPVIWSIFEFINSECIDTKEKDLGMYG